MRTQRTNTNASPAATPRRHVRRAMALGGAAIIAAGLFGAAARAQRSAPSDQFLLIRDDLSQSQVRIGSLDESKLHYLDAGRGWRAVPLEQCVALLRPDAKFPRLTTGVVNLSDGQVLPGVALSNADPKENALVWNHPWIGRMELPLDAISSVTFSADAVPPPPGIGDVVRLVNGDLLSGLILELGDPLILETETPDGRQTQTIPADRVAAVTLVTAGGRHFGAVHEHGRRIWFTDGTIVDVQRVLVGDDGYVRLAPNPAGKTSLQAQRPLNDVAAVFFETGRLLPLATVQPASTGGPETRFTIPRPVAMNPSVVGRLSSIEYRGPLTVRYMLPENARRFAAVAEIPEESRTWGDFELIIECDGREVFHGQLNGANPVAAINTAIDGREFTITMHAGAHGPIQDVLVLKRPMFLLSAE